jgi:ATP-binding cassette subfamily B protein
MSENRQRAQGVRQRPGLGGAPGGHGPGGFGRPVEKPKDFMGTLRRLLAYLKPRRFSLLVVALFTVASTSFMIYGPKVSARAINRLTEGVVAKIAVSQVIRAEQNESVKAMLAHAGIPPLEEGQTPAQMGEALEKFLRALKNIPADQLEQITGSSRRTYAVTEEQEAAIVAYVYEMGNRIDFDSILRILLAMLALYAVSSGFLFATHYIMSSVSQRTMFDLRRDMNEKLARLPLKFFDSRTHGEIMSRMTNDIDTISQTLQQNLVQVLSSMV